MNLNGSIFSKFSQIWTKIGSNLRNFGEKRVIFFPKIWPKIEQIGIWMGHFFLKNWYLYMGLLSILRRHIPTKTKLEYPPAKFGIRF